MNYLQICPLMNLWGRMRWNWGIPHRTVVQLWNRWLEMAVGICILRSFQNPFGWGQDQPDLTVKLAMP